ncbi:hypothetical protein [Bacillus sp. C28GYM-DRY-1]|uniref:hypothetical protein n=1 Tax=Bacillus sp. C28GYM-DRY-1 TaxID=3062686 RepID=UPI0026751B0B|nr:hypothetical protein [Bacillus sp. C28GYM-DRY-1]MDO3660003.1 hypothetical protein [Bacillus sp. C28GYM-DRY-1]
MAEAEPEFMQFICMVSLLHLFVDLGIKAETVKGVGIGAAAGAYTKGILSFEKAAQLLLKKQDGWSLTECYPECDLGSRLVIPDGINDAASEEIWQNALALTEETLPMKEEWERVCRQDDAVICFRGCQSKAAIHIQLAHSPTKALLKALGELFTRGGHILHEKLYPEPIQKLPLPPYPFDKKTYRVSPPEEHERRDSVTALKRIGKISISQTLSQTEKQDIAKALSIDFI